MIYISLKLTCLYPEWLVQGFSNLNLSLEEITAKMQKEKAYQMHPERGRQVVNAQSGALFVN